MSATSFNTLIRQAIMAYISEHPEMWGEIISYITSLKGVSESDESDPEWKKITVTVSYPLRTWYQNNWLLPTRIANVLDRKDILPEKALFLTKEEWLEIKGLGVDSWLIFTRLRKIWAETELKKLVED